MYIHMYIHRWGTLLEAAGFPDALGSSDWMVKYYHYYYHYCYYYYYDDDYYYYYFYYYK